MTPTNCYCGSDKSFVDCCEIFIKGIQKAPTAEALMRSRYCAYVTQAVDYLMATTQVSQRKFHSEKDILHWAINNKWIRLEIIATAENRVEFKAFYCEIQTKPDTISPTQIHHEKSTFVFENGSWFYVDGLFY